MIKHSVRYDNYAYRLSDVPASAELIAKGWEEGEFLSFNENGELIKATADTVPFMSMSSSRKGRQQFLGKTTLQQLSCLAQQELLQPIMMSLRHMHRVHLFMLMQMVRLQL